MMIICLPAPIPPTADTRTITVTVREPVGHSQKLSHNPHTMPTPASASALLITDYLAQSGVGIIGKDISC
jgi:hypothetical protein